MSFTKRIALGILAVLMLLTFSGCGNEQEADKNTTSGNAKLVVGIHDNFPPIIYRDKMGNFVGFDVDLLQEIGKRLNCDIEFKGIDWSKKEEALANGQVDMISSGCDITEERKKYILFSDPYMDNRQIIFVRKNTFDITDEQSLAGKAVGIQDVATASEYVDNSAFFRTQVKKIRKYTRLVEAFMDLEPGRLDAVIGDECVGLYYMSQHPNKMDVVDVTVGPTTSYGIGFAKDNHALRNKVQKTLDAMKADGTLTKISYDWFGKDLSS